MGKRVATEWTQRQDAYFIDHLGLFLDSIKREVGCTDLLRDTTSFTFLNVGLSDLWLNEH
jgi:hypothetical protein